MKFYVYVTKYTSQKYKIYRYQMSSFKLQMHQNLFSARALPWTPLWSLYDALPDLLVGWGGDTSHTFPLSMPRSRLCVYCISVLRPHIPTKSSGYAYVVREEGAPNDFLAGGAGMGSSRTGLDLEDNTSRTKFCGLGLEDLWPWP